MNVAKMRKLAESQPWDKETEAMFKEKIAELEAIQAQTQLILDRMGLSQVADRVGQ